LDIAQLKTKLNSLLLSTLLKNAGLPVSASMEKWSKLLTSTMENLKMKKANAGALMSATVSSTLMEMILKYSLLVTGLMNSQ
jgi:hypothetical protein